MPYRMALPENTSAKCLDCGQPAHYKIVHDGDVIKREFYCEACC
jgi:hypothetical protein